MTTTTTTINYPKPGDFVAVEECGFVSGNSSIPFIIPVAEHLGTLTKIDDTTYSLVEDGATVATLTSVYLVEEDGWKQPRLLVSGWKADNGGLTHTRWIITN